MSVATLSSHNYEGEIQDISILHCRAKQEGEPLKEEEQFTIRSELAELMRVARIGRHGALYYASASAQTFETVDGTKINPIHCDEIVDANLTRSIGNIKRKRIQCYDGSRRKSPGSVNRANSTNG